MSIETYTDGDYTIHIEYPTAEVPSNRDVIVTVRNCTAWARERIRMSPIGFAPHGTVRMLIAEIERDKRKNIKNIIDLHPEI